MGDDGSKLPARASASRRVVVVAGALLVLAFGGYLAFATLHRPHFLGTTVNVALPGVALVDDRGEPFTFSELRGKAYALFFGYTHCLDTCPTTLAKLERARTGLPQALQRATTIVFVTVDPDRDTPAVLRKYMPLFGPGLIGVTGGPEQLKTLDHALWVWSVRIGKGPNYEMGHSSAIYFVDPRGRVVVVHLPADSTATLAHDFAELTK